MFTMEVPKVVPQAAQLFYSAAENILPSLLNTDVTSKGAVSAAASLYKKWCLRRR
jgi:hypothetical protein